MAVKVIDNFLRVGRNEIASSERMTRNAVLSLYQNYLYQYQNNAGQKEIVQMRHQHRNLRRGDGR